MPIYLIPLPKTENETVINPWQSIGGKAFDPHDPESMEYLRELHDRAQEQIRPERRSLLTPVFALFGVRYPPENPTVTDFRERWGRPFEDIVAEATASPEDYLVRWYDPHVLEETDCLKLFKKDFPEFPFYALYDFEGPGGEPMTNHVIARNEAAEDAFFSIADEVPKHPAEMRRAAEIFDNAAADYQPDADDTHPEASLLTARAAAEWLRLWADRGHPCEAQRLIWSGQGWYRVEVG